MAARDVQPNRFVAARQAVADLLNGVAGDTHLWLVTSGPKPRIVVEDGTPANVIQALDTLQPEPGANDLASALRLAAGLAAPQAANGSQVIAVTDGAFDLQLPPQAVPVSFKLVGGSGQNLGLSEVTLRRPIDRADYLAGFARLVNFSGEPRGAVITIVADGVPVDRSPVEVPAAGHSEATFHVPAAAQTVSVVLADRGSLAAADRVDVAGYTRSSRRVTIVSDAPAIWEHVLSVVPDVTTRSIRPADLASTTDVGPDDVVLLDNVAPTGVAASGLIYANPPDSSLVLSRVDTLPRQRHAASFDADDPLLRGLDIAPLSIQQLERASTPAWAAASVEAEDTPLILHGRMGDQRTVVFTFDPNKSNLPHLAAFPLLMANAIDWLTPGREAVLHGGLGSQVNIEPRAHAELAASSAAPAQPSLSEIWPWLLAAAGLFFALEWAVAVRRG
jgi:hypothetical protein